MKAHAEFNAVFGAGHSALAFLLVGLLLGCASHKSSDASPPPVAVQTARLTDLQQNRMIPVNSFSSHEGMAAVIQNLTIRDQMLKIELVRQDNGLTIWKNAVKVPKAEVLVTGPTARLPVGDYTVKVSRAGMQPITFPF